MRVVLSLLVVGLAAVSADVTEEQPEVDPEGVAHADKDCSNLFCKDTNDGHAHFLPKLNQETGKCECGSYFTEGPCAGMQCHHKGFLTKEVPANEVCVQWLSAVRLCVVRLPSPWSAVRRYSHMERDRGRLCRRTRNRACASIRALTNFATRRACRSSTTRAESMVGASASLRWTSIFTTRCRRTRRIRGFRSTVRTTEALVDSRGVDRIPMNTCPNVHSRHVLLHRRRR